MRVGYSYLHVLPGPVPDWFGQQMKAYLEGFLPAYYSRYLNADVTLEPAPAVTDDYVKSGEWLNYFVDARRQATWGYDSMIIMTDAPYTRIIPGERIAGTNYYLARPNFAWASVRNWQEVEALARTPFYQKMPQEEAVRYAFMYGRPDDAGIRALTVAGHEITHYVLLTQGGPKLSAQIDGGRLSGLALLDTSLNQVQAPAFDPPNWTWAAQRVCGCLTCDSGMGAYSCETFPF